MARYLARQGRPAGLCPDIPSPVVSKVRDMVPQRCKQLEAKFEAAKLSKGWAVVAYLGANEVREEVFMELGRLEDAAIAYDQMADTAREQASLAEHHHQLKPSHSMSPQVQDDPLMALAARTSEQQHTMLMNTENIAVQTERRRAYVKALRTRRLQMGVALADGSEPPQETQDSPGGMSVMQLSQMLNAYNHRLLAFQKCNRQLHASIIRHAAVQAYKEKRRLHLVRSMQQDVGQDSSVHQQALEELAMFLDGRMETEDATRLLAELLAELDERLQQSRAALDAFEDIKADFVQEKELYDNANIAELIHADSLLDKLAANVKQTAAEMEAAKQELAECMTAEEYSMEPLDG